MCAAVDILSAASDPTWHPWPHLTSDIYLATWQKMASHHTMMVLAGTGIEFLEFEWVV